MASRALNQVDFFDDIGAPIPGLVAVHERGGKKTKLSIDEQAAVFEAAPFDRIDYVFFRRFSDGRSSQVAAYVVDNTDAGALEFLDPVIKDMLPGLIDTLVMVDGGKLHIVKPQKLMDKIKARLCCK